MGLFTANGASAGISSDLGVSACSDWSVSSLGAGFGSVV